jgi:hypothetical protein
MASECSINNRLLGERLEDFNQLIPLNVYILARLHTILEFVADNAIFPPNPAEYIAHPVRFVGFDRRIGKYIFLNFNGDEESYYNFDLIDDDNVLQIYLPQLPPEIHSKISNFVQRGGKSRNRRKRKSSKQRKRLSMKKRK